MKPKMKKRILIFGGTGAMGTSLVEILEKEDVEVYITSRSERKSENENVHYIKGNAKSLEFCKKTLEEQWDCIVDFMVYSLEEFKSRVDLLLASTMQYIFVSSARVYADSEELLTEDSPRLLDVCTDVKYLRTNEYALEKARQENELFNRGKAGKRNWTIVRPSLTYSNDRLQLGVYEKETWLRRVLDGKKLVFSKDLMERYYTMTTGKDVAKGIAALIGAQGANGEAFHIVADRACQWKEILQIYLDTLKKAGYSPMLTLTDTCTNLEIPGYKYQVVYGRYFNRRFDNSKIAKYVDVTQFEDPKEGLRRCLELFLEEPTFRKVSWIVEGRVDRATGERAVLSMIPTAKDRVMYLLSRYNMYVWFQFASSAVKHLKKLKYYLP